MVLFRSGNRGKLIEINTKDFTLSFHGDITNQRVSRLGINRNVTAKLFVKGYGNNEICIKTLTNLGRLAENKTKTMMPCFFENGQYQVTIEMNRVENYEIYHNGINISNNFEIVGNIYLGVIDFSSDIGLTDIDIVVENKKVLKVTIEVFPSKIDYYKDYKELINEVNAEISSLAFKLLDKTYLKSNLKDVKYQTNIEFISILNIIFDDLIKALKRIESNLKHNIININRVAKISRAKKISKRTRSFLRAHPKLLMKSSNGVININGENYMPLKVVEENKITTVNTYENSYVKYMLQRMIKRLKNIEKLLRNNDLEKYPYINIKTLKEKRLILEYHLNKYFSNISDLNGKKSMSLVFQMAPGYKEMYKKCLILNKGLNLGEELFKITPKKIYSLYEIWCYIKIHKILLDLGYEVEEHGILQYKDNGLYLSLLYDSETKMVYSNNKNKLELCYNKSYSSPTTTQRPDTSLYIRNINDKNSRIYIFDAKYRISIDSNGNVGPMEEDINAMHRYRDAIVSKISPDFKYKYDTFGAYVMFPYGDEEKFRSHKFYKSIEKVNVGAFPMLPGNTKLIREQLEKIINQSDLEAKNERLIIDEYDDYAKFKLENVMVVNVRDKEHMRAYLENNFYHIPAKYLSNIRLGVEYIAFYQPKRIFGDDGGIKYYAKIKNIMRYRRSECEELPAKKGTEDELYLRFNLDTIQETSHIKPIQAGTRLVSYTTLYLLINAQNMHELKFRSNLEIEVYKRLKKIAKLNGYSIRKESEQYIINNNIVEVIEGKVVRVNGKITDLRKIENMIV